MNVVNSETDEKEPEWNQHWSTMEALPRDLQIPVEEIRQPYEITLKEYNENAKVKVYLHLLVGPKVREIIKEKFISYA